MNTTKTMLEHVTVERLKNYLIGKGWTEEPFGREEVLKFVSPTDDWEIIIPSRRDLIDYEYTTKLAVRSIANFEDRAVDDVLSDILPCVLVELIELRSLIVDCERLIDKHGGDFALRQSLESLKARERNLEIEVMVGDAPVLFGLGQQGHLSTIERMLAAGSTWDEIGQEIGWCPETAKEHYGWQKENGR